MMKGKFSCKVGKYTCRCSYKIIGVTTSVIEDFNKLLSKEGRTENERDSEKTACA